MDVDFVRRSVRCIGRCAINVESTADRCIETLISLIQTQVNYVVQEATVVIKVTFSSSFSSLSQRYMEMFEVTYRVTKKGYLPEVPESLRIDDWYPV